MEKNLPTHSHSNASCETILEKCGLTRFAVFLARSEGALRPLPLRILNATRSEICAAVAQITRPRISEMSIQPVA